MTFTGMSKVPQPFAVRGNAWSGEEPRSQMIRSRSGNVGWSRYSTQRILDRVSGSVLMKTVHSQRLLPICFDVLPLVIVCDKQGIETISANKARLRLFPMR